MNTFEEIKKRSPGLIRVFAELEGDQEKARKLALEEFVWELAMRFGADKADELATRYKFTRDDIVKYATYAVDIMRKAEGMEPHIKGVIERYKLPETLSV